MTDEVLAPLCLEASNSTSIGPERFARNFTHRSKQYGKALREEASRSEQRAAASLIC